MQVTEMLKFDNNNQTSLSPLDSKSIFCRNTTKILLTKVLFITGEINRKHMEFVYCVECGLVSNKGGVKGNSCGYCNRQTEFKNLPREALRLISPEEVNKKFRSVYNLFTKGEMKDIDFLMKE